MQENGPHELDIHRADYRVKLLSEKSNPGNFRGAESRIQQDGRAAEESSTSTSDLVFRAPGI